MLHQNFSADVEVHILMEAVVDRYHLAKVDEMIEKFLVIKSSAKLTLGEKHARCGN